MKKEFWTAVVAAWILVALGVGHTVVGLVSFKKPLTEAIRAGLSDNS